jgi:Xaa-Pro aminopeptidase
MQYNSDSGTPLAELLSRIRRFQDRLQCDGVDGALILQNSDLFYFADTIQQCHLYIPADGEPLLMVYRHVGRAGSETSLPQMTAIDSPRQVPQILKKRGCFPAGTLGLELDVLPAARYFGFQHLFPGSDIVDVSHTIRLTRMVKSEYEIARIRQSARLADRLAGRVPELLREGMTEIELAGRLESIARGMGHQGTVRMRLWGAEIFYGHLMAGAAAAVPSYLSSPTGGMGPGRAVAQGAGFRPIGRHEPILVDYAFACQGYLADHTRIFCMGGLPDELLEGHAAMLRLQETVKKAATPGRAAGDIYELACSLAAEDGYADFFMGPAGARVNFVGHGLGIELDEYPFLARGQELSLEENMVIALEPKLVFPGRGVVGIENTHVITAGGLEQLTCQDEAVITVA